MNDIKVPLLDWLPGLSSVCTSKVLLYWTFAGIKGLLCLVGILLAFLILPVINGGDLSVFRPVLLIYALVHLLACMAGIAFASRLALAKSPMALLQAKE